ncbi:hypothetical protein [Flavobacterium sp.]|uniref:hypothetical protein n=1 Tax=Flavobacterium sp. TaxID=239 RepID=UPI002B4AF951|nr:hypothetical protein [Flavobacterium sp.]HLP63267.1 hypothetical protein [Flavobacterium sp.]
MSTEIKNTLFRFVTMRAPELSNEEGIKSRFVFMDPRLLPTEVRTFEDAVLNRPNTQTKWEAMSETTLSFVPKKETELKDFSRKIYDFSVWVAKNKRNFSYHELLQKLHALAGEKITLSQLNLLWDNLFYQVITKKDFYAKETIMHLLIGNHVFLHQTEIQNSEELAKQILLAKVVLPKELFVETDGTSNGSIARIAPKDSGASSSTYRTAPSAEMMKLRQTHEERIRISELSKLKKELQKAEKKFKKEAKEAFDIQAQSHQETIKTINDQYFEDVKTAKETWCALQDPNSTYDSQHPCNQPEEVEKPQLPTFVFQFRNEMDLSFLESELTPESFKSLLTLLEIEFSSGVNGKADPESIADLSGDGYSYAQSYSIIDSGISQSNQTIVNNLPSQNNVVASVGGVVVPVTTSSTALPFSFQLCPSRNAEGLILFDIKIEVPDSTWEVKESESYHQMAGVNSTATNGLFVASEIGTSILLKTSAIYDFDDSLTATSIEGKIEFTNGTEATFSVPNSPSASFFKSCFNGDLTLKQDDDNSGSNNGSVPTTNFIPTGFGFKQIGIADYKKVEQTTQGYVEGDVAHIENVMAREYKEKATRRLRRSENTTTTSSENEREKLTDTTSTDRFEMQSEVAKVLQEANDFATNTYANFNGGQPGAGTYSIGGNVNMATHSSSEESSMNAVNQAKEITERAMDRIVSKVKEERIEKIIEEFEENNKHGFDNTKGDKHVVGVYRWVDKVFKNQVFNYGKRLMFEFMVPQPSKLHILGMTENQMVKQLVEPVDPRKHVDPVGTLPENTKKLSDYKSVDENTAKYWGSVFNIELNPKPQQTIYIGKAFSGSGNEANGGEFEEVIAGDINLKIPEFYKTVTASGLIYAPDEPAVGWHFLIGGKRMNELAGHQEISAFEGEIPISYSLVGYHAVSGTVEVKCELTPTGLEKWQQETFKAIIDAYEDALVEYNQKLAEENALGVKIKGENPGFYRQIENTVLRKNCISYMINQDPNAARTYGRSMFKALNQGVIRTFGNHEVNVSAELDDYAAFAKFMEQAFEWEIMSYNFYPYYWSDRKDWADLYQYDNNDPLFRNFMQAGMARVIVTVRPGFEEAVRFYMQTGEIWNGGEVPVIDDELFLSIVDELQSPKGKKEGKAWATRLPTALTILQADSIGLRVTKALPFDEDALPEFENPEEVPVSEGLEISYDLLGSSQLGRVVGKIFGNENKEAKIVVKNYLDDTLRDLTYCDANGNWELNSVPVGKYKLVLDANNDFPTTDYEVTEGSKEVTVELAANQTAEINLTIQPLT